MPAWVFICVGASVGKCLCGCCCWCKFVHLLVWVCVSVGAGVVVNVSAIMTKFCGGCAIVFVLVWV